MSDALPILRFHGPTRQYYVWLSVEKKRKTFGRDKELAKQRYAVYLAGIMGTTAAPYVPPSMATVVQALESYRQFANERYKDATERARIETAMSAVIELYGNQPVAAVRQGTFPQLREQAGEHHQDDLAMAGERRTRAGGIGSVCLYGPADSTRRRGA